MGDEVLDPELGVAGQGVGDLVARSRGSRAPGRRRSAPSKATKIPAVRVRRGGIAPGLVERAADVRQARAQVVGLPRESRTRRRSTGRRTPPRGRACAAACRRSGSAGRRGGSVGGSSSTSSARWYRPSKLTRSPRRSGATISRPSSKRADAVVERVAEGVELGLVPSAAEAEDQPTVAHLVELGRHLGGERRVAEREREHERPDLDARRHRRDGGQHGPALVDAGRRPVVAKDEVVGAPHRVEPAGLGRERHRRAGRRIPRSRRRRGAASVRSSCSLMLASRMPTGRLPYGRDRAPTRRHPRDRRAAACWRARSRRCSSPTSARTSIKVEPPDGDETRTWGPPWWGDPADRRSAYFASVNRNKRSVVLDLRTDDGRAALRPPAGRRPTCSSTTTDRPRPPALAWRPRRSAHRHPSLVVATVGGFARRRCRSSGLRPAGAGRQRPDVGHRRAGRAADEGRRRAARPDRRAWSARSARWRRSSGGAASSAVSSGPRRGRA